MKNMLLQCILVLNNRIALLEHRHGFGSVSDFGDSVKETSVTISVSVPIEARFLSPKFFFN